MTFRGSLGPQTGFEIRLTASVIYNRINVLAVNQICPLITSAALGWSALQWGHFPMSDGWVYTPNCRENVEKREYEQETNRLAGKAAQHRNLSAISPVPPGKDRACSCSDSPLGALVVLCRRSLRCGRVSKHFVSGPRPIAGKSNSSCWVLHWLLGGLVCYACEGIQVEAPRQPPKTNQPASIDQETEWYPASYFVLPGRGGKLLSPK